MQFEQRFLIGCRPSNVPAGAVIVNAPRPLYGSLVNGYPLTWQGNFCSGIFYAAVLADDPARDKWLDLNRRNGAIVLTHITEREALDMVRPSLIAEYPELSCEDFDLVWADVFDARHRVSRIEL